MHLHHQPAIVAELILILQTDCVRPVQLKGHHAVAVSTQSAAEGASGQKVRQSLLQSGCGGLQNLSPFAKIMLMSLSSQAAHHMA